MKVAFEDKIATTKKYVQQTVIMTHAQMAYTAGLDPLLSLSEVQHGACSMSKM